MVRQEASLLFPTVSWTGGSHIHASLAKGAYLPINVFNATETLYTISKANVGLVIWKELQHHFGHMEWLEERDSFINLFMVDMRRQLDGKPALQTPDQLRNPDTGSVFHRMALLNEWVGGVRWWIDPAGDGCHLGFRFRLEKLSGEDEEVSVRETARIRAELVQEEVAEVYGEFMEIGEPQAEKVAEISQMIMEWES